MTLTNLKDAEYIVCRLGGFTLSQALRFWKAKYETIKHFTRDIIKHPQLEPLGQFVEEVWETIVPISVTEALKEKNMEIRRVMFDCIGVAKLFQQLEPELLDRQVIPKMRFRWDKKLEIYQHNFNDTYELYVIEGEKLFETENRWNKPNPVYAVRCWCTTTEREYWIYVPLSAALNKQHLHETPTPDAIRAIAWTIRIDITNPKRIYRQGDIIVVVESEDSRTTTPYHLSKDQYLNLMYSET